MLETGRQIGEIVVLSGYGGLLATAVITDVGWLRIPNLVPLLLAVLFVVAQILSPQPNWLSHLAAGLLVFAVGFGLFAWGKLGGGDVKLIAVVALWHGLWLLPALLLLIGLAGGVVALACIAVRQSGIGTYLAAHGIDAVSLQDGAGVPYAVAIAAASALLLPQLPIVGG
jgi:prepilin peptidase CpaA